MKLTFWGAARTVTGSMHMIEVEAGPRILLDCGLYQGEDVVLVDINQSFPCPPRDIDVLVLSHAHIDHCGNIPQFVKKGFSGKIYCTHATYDLCTIMLADSAEIQEKDVERDNRWRKKKGEKLLEPLYTVEDVAPAMEHFHTIPYESWVSIAPGVELLFRDAGHMLGSATVTLRIQEKGRTFMMGFTGDVGRPDKPILRDPVPMPQVDYLISESTYGGKEHDPFGDAEGKLLEIIQETCVKKGGKLMIPAFSVGRTQDLVHTLDRLANEGRLPRVPVYVDSPLAVDATRIYEMHPECFDQELTDYMRHDPHPFGFNRLHYVRNVEESKKLNEKSGGMIIIASSGMANAGRILHHFINGIGNVLNTVLIVGYCAEGTIGSRLVNGEKKIRIFGEEYEVKAEIIVLNSYSAHAGQTELYHFLDRQEKEKLKQLFLVHGEEKRSFQMKAFLEERGFMNISVPKRGDSIELT